MRARDQWGRITGAAPFCRTFLKTASKGVLATGLGAAGAHVRAAPQPATATTHSGTTIPATADFSLDIVEVDNLMIGTAERYDLLVTVPESGNFPLHAAALGDDKWVGGLIHTRGAPASPKIGPPRFEGRYLSFEQLRAIDDSRFPKGPERGIDLRLSGNMAKYVWLMNDVAYPELFAPPDARNVPLEVGYGEVVHITLTNPTPMYHPMHLHGHVFRVLGGRRGTGAAQGHALGAATIDPRDRVLRQQSGALVFPLPQPLSHGQRHGPRGPLRRPPESRPQWSPSRIGYAPYPPFESGTPERAGESVVAALRKAAAARQNEREAAVEAAGARIAESCSSVPRPPTGFFGYPGNPSLLSPSDAQIHVLARLAEVAVAAPNGLGDKLGAPANVEIPKGEITP